MRRSDEPMPGWVPRAIIVFWLVFAALVISYWLVRELRTLLIMLLVSLFISFALEPAVNWMSERHGMRRGVATGLSMLVVVLLIAGFVAIMGSLLATQINSFVDAAPGYIEEIEDWAKDTFDVELNADELIAEFQTGGAIRDFATNLAGNLVDLGTRVLSLLLSVFTIGLFTFYLIADGPRLRRAICSTLPPDRQREVLRVWDLAIQKTGGYIYSRAILAILSSMFHTIVFAIIGVPFPLPLAIWVGIISQFVPVIGTYLAGLLPIVIALVDDPISAIWVTIAIIVYQQIENYLLAPRITARTMEIHAAVAFGSVIAGGLILGPVGALLALPAAATLQAFVSSYLSRYELVESHLTQTDRHDENNGNDTSETIDRDLTTDIGD